MTSNTASNFEKHESFVISLLESADVIDDKLAQSLFKALVSVDRSRFVIESERGKVFEDISLQIENNQFSPKPSVLVRMLSLLGDLNRQRVLEIGCGTGYTASILSELGAYVFTVEVIGRLAQSARKQMDSSGYQNIILQRGDGFDGWSDQAPFDRIIFSTVVKKIPEVMFDQLGEGGRMIAPIRKDGKVSLVLWEKLGGDVKNFQLESVQFDGTC